jgi:hypothetical protein
MLDIMPLIPTMKNGLSLWLGLNGGLATYRNAPGVLDRQSINGGGSQNRTDDILLAKQALSQLSYTPW